MYLTGARPAGQEDVVSEAEGGGDIASGLNKNVNRGGGGGGMGGSGEIRKCTCCLCCALMPGNRRSVPSAVASAAVSAAAAAAAFVLCRRRPFSVRRPPLNHSLQSVVHRSLCAPDAVSRARACLVILRPHIHNYYYSARDHRTDDLRRSRRGKKKFKKTIRSAATTSSPRSFFFLTRFAFYRLRDGRSSPTRGTTHVCGADRPLSTCHRERLRASVRRWPRSRRAGQRQLRNTDMARPELSSSSTLRSTRRRSTA